MKTEELPYQTMEARDTHLGDVSTRVKAKGGKRRKQVPRGCLSLPTRGAASCVRRFARAHVIRTPASQRLTSP